MLRIKYRGYTISQQQQFGPLRLLKWVENGKFIVIKDDIEVLPGAAFQTPDDAKKAIDLQLEYNDNLRKFFRS
jgi:hypothetical protein